MKIEMGESLIYSWLRHIKKCQIVQTNWKASPKWELHNESDIYLIMNKIDEYFGNKYNYEIFKNNSSLLQVLRQGECDAIGIKVCNAEVKYYAVDVAFHTMGLNYGDKNKTVSKVIEKCVRTAMCIYGYFESKCADIIFASPKINPAIMSSVELCLEDLNNIFKVNNFDFRINISSNNDFNHNILIPVLSLGEEVADTSELFLRAYQMIGMFGSWISDEPEVKHDSGTIKTKSDDINEYNLSVYESMKVGEIAKTILRSMLEKGMASREEVELMQTAEYSKITFHLNYPLLIPDDPNLSRKHYYSNYLYIYGKKYYICREWFHQKGNDDKPYLINWIEKHKKEVM